MKSVSHTRTVHQLDVIENSLLVQMMSSMRQIARLHHKVVKEMTSLDFEPSRVPLRDSYGDAGPFSGVRALLFWKPVSISPYDATDCISVAFQPIIRTTGSAGLSAWDYGCFEFFLFRQMPATSNPPVKL